MTRNQSQPIVESHRRLRQISLKRRSAALYRTHALALRRTQRTRSAMQICCYMKFWGEILLMIVSSQVKSIIYLFLVITFVRVPFEDENKEGWDQLRDTTIVITATFGCVVFVPVCPGCKLKSITLCTLLLANFHVDITKKLPSYQKKSLMQLFCANPYIFL